MKPLTPKPLTPVMRATLLALRSADEEPEIEWGLNTNTLAALESRGLAASIAIQRVQLRWAWRRTPAGDALALELAAARAS